MRLSLFWADVLRPAFHALAPEEPRVLACRVRNAAAGAAFFAALLPRFGPLGTGTVQHANVLVGVYAVAAVGAHLRRDHARGGAQAVGILVVAGLAPLWLSQGLAWWGVWLAFAGVLQLGAAAWRRRDVELPPVPREDDGLPAKATRGFPVLLGSVAYSLATVLVFWTLVTQHMKVPTGSMQPTILGDHGMGRYGGDHLLADHMVYALRDPRRFEIVVFRYPLRRDILFVKRLVGLPGEKLEIKGGDIWVNGAIVRKPPLVQESLWQEIFPRHAAAPSARKKDVANAWRASEDDGWRKAGPDALRIAPRDGRLGVAAFRDHLRVPDVRVGFDAAPADDTAVAVLRVTTRGSLVTLEVPAQGDGALLQVGGADPIPLAASLGAGARVELAVADGLARALVDGVQVGSADVPTDGSGRVRAEVGGKGGALVLSALRLEEDIEYVGAGGSTTFDIPPGKYVVLGDNTGNSVDSRMWRAGAIHVEGHAQPYVFERVSPDLAGGQVRNLVREGGRVRFTDADGLPRDFAASAITKEDPPTARPFVRREDFVGRAALIFWPVPPFGSSFRPRLLP